MPAALAVPLLALVVVLTAYSLAALQHSQSAGLLGWLASKARAIPIFGGLSADQVLKLDAWMTHQIGKHFNATVSRAVTWIAGLREYVLYIASASLNLAPLLWSQTWWLVHTEIPRLIKAHTRHQAQQAAHADATATTAAKTAANVAKSHPGTVSQKTVTRIQRVAMPRAYEWDWIGHHWHALTRAVANTALLPLAVPHPYARPLPMPYGLTIRNLRRRMHRVEALLGVTAFAAVLAHSLGVSVRCVRPGGNLGRFARAVCGAPSWIMRFLVAGAIEAFILSDLCDFSDLLIAQAENLRPALMTLVDVENALVGCHDFTAPNTFALDPVSLPALVDAVALAA